MDAPGAATFLRCKMANHFTAKQGVEIFIACYACFNCISPLRIPVSRKALAVEVKLDGQKKWENGTGQRAGERGNVIFCKISQINKSL